jgi:Cytidylate kinase-like family
VPSRVVCISHAPGAAGKEVGLIVSKRLGFRCLDEAIVVEAARKEHLDPDLVADVERRRSLVARLYAQLGTTTFVDASPGLWQMPVEGGQTGEVYRSLIREVIRDIAEQGDVVIVAHAASMALAERSDVLRVLVTASLETRVARTASGGRLSEAEAAKAVKKADAARADYFRRFYRIDRELPTHYDLVLNTDALTPDVAADLVYHAAVEKGGG